MISNARQLTIQRFDLAALAIIAAAVIMLLGTSDWLTKIPCQMDCGETFTSLDQAQQFKRFGFEWGLLQDHATSNDIAAHPYLYTHNISLPTIVFPLLAGLGVEAVSSFQIITLIGFALGLMYIYLATQRLTGSRLLGLITLVFMATDYLHVFSFGLNALRAWHWVALFGTIYHVDLLASNWSGVRPRLKDIGWLLLFAGLSFCIGYDFWIICFAVSFAIVLVFHRPRPARLVAMMLLLGLFFAIPFALRQIHVMSVLGWEFWWYDFLVSAALKVPMVGDFVDIPSLTDIDILYQENGIVRAPALPPGSLISILQTMVTMWVHKVMPSFGIVSTAIMLASPFVVFGVFFSKVCIQAQSFSLKRTPLPIAATFTLVLPSVVTTIVLSVTYLNSVPSTLLASVLIAPFILLLASTSDRRVCKVIAVLAQILPYVAALFLFSIAGISTSQIGFTVVLGCLASIAPIHAAWVGDDVAQNLSVNAAAMPFISASTVLLSIFNPYLIVFTLFAFALWRMAPARIDAGATSIFPSMAAALAALNLGLLHRSGTPSILELYGTGYALVIALVAIGCIALGAFVAAPAFRSATLRLLEVLMSPFSTAHKRVSREYSQGDEPIIVDPQTMVPLLRLSMLLLALVFGVAIGMAIFSPLSLHIYMKHQFPLLAAPIYLAKTLVFAVLLALGQYLLLRRHAGRWFVAGALAFIVLDHAVIQTSNLNEPKIDTSWVEVVPKYADSSIAVSWVAEVVDAFSNSWSVGIAPGNEANIVSRISDGKHPFDTSEYFVFGQRDKDTREPGYDYPDYWLYFPTDVSNDFDQPERPCKYDYLRGFVERMRQPRVPVTPTSSVLQLLPIPGPFAPGSSIGVYGLLETSSSAILGVEARIDDVFVAPLSFNCIYGQFKGAINLPEDLAPGTYTMNFVIKYVGNSEIIVATRPLTVANGARMVLPPQMPTWLRSNQPSAQELAASLPDIPVAERGDQWVLFDMKAWYARQKE